MDGIAEGVLPTLLHIGLRSTMASCPSSGPAGIELLHPGNAGGFHPIQICLDALFGDVSVHPMPPNPDPRILRRILEIIIITLRRGSYGKKPRPLSGY